MGNAVSGYSFFSNPQCKSNPKAGELHIGTYGLKLAVLKSDLNVKFTICVLGLGFLENTNELNCFEHRL